MFFSLEGKVIIVIGGDDNYKSEDEKDRVVISRWARMKIQTQFKDEFLDGRKSFIFSWNKKHRAIHEEALLHFFDLSKKGQKFEYQPKPKQLEVVKAAHTSSERAPLHKCQSMNEQRGEVIRSSSPSSAEKRRGDYSVGRSRSADGTSSFSPPNTAELTKNDPLFDSASGAALATFDSEHGAKSKEPPSASTGKN